ILGALQDSPLMVAKERVSRTLERLLAQPTDAAVEEWAQVLRRARLEAAASELSQLLDSGHISAGFDETRVAATVTTVRSMSQKTSLSEAEQEQAREFQRLIKELKGSSGGE